MQVEISSPDDFEAWIALTRQIESLFGPMSDDPDYCAALQKTIAAQCAFCVRAENSSKLLGGIIISKELNEIVWLAVDASVQRCGIATTLMEYALARLDETNAVFVQTFAASMPEGFGARKLYTKFGFVDYRDAGPNPAGFATVIMQKLPTAHH